MKELFNTKTTFQDILKRANLERNIWVILLFAILTATSQISLAASTQHTTSAAKKHPPKHSTQNKKKKTTKPSIKKLQATPKHKKSITHKATTKHTTSKHKLKKHTQPSSKKKHAVKKIKRINKPNIQDDTALITSENSNISLTSGTSYEEALNTETSKNLNSKSFARSSLVASLEKKLVSFVHKSVATLRYSAYKLGGTHFDISRGVYIVDCSAYVDHTLRAVYPNAYSNLVNSTGSDKPNTLNYYNFFTELSEDSNEHWSKVKDVEQLRPGDILVFRYKNSQGNITGGGGHVMVIMKKPVRDEEGYLVSVADSAPVGHSEDTRSHNVSGIGIGTLVLKVNPKTGHPSAYAWKVGSRWKNNVSFAMARPLDINSQDVSEV